ncbi:MAG: low temperature requirement protein A [Coriobacteriia bacterium]|nr:low temperature requirement protein A [Coriobacteriia bacterium]
MVDEPLWWRRPMLREDDDETRRASWLELFVDLMFVAIISACARGLALDVTLAGVGRFIVVFLPAWWIWLGLTVYNDRLDTDDVSHRLSFFAIMLALGGMAVSAREFFGGGFAIYALSYVAARVVIVGLWLRGGLHNPRLRPLTTRYAIGFSLAAALWLVALALPWPARLWVVLAAIVIDFGTPALTMAAQSTLPRLSRSHLPERFGLFILIVLGESVISVEQAVGNNYLRGSLAHITAGPAALALAFVLWWLYFDHVAENPPLPGALMTLAWSYPHLVLALALGMLGAGIQAYVGVASANPRATTMLVCVAVGAAYAMIGVLEFMTEPSAERHHPVRSLGVHGGSAFVAVFAGFLSGITDDVWIFLVLVALGVLQIVYGFATRARHLRWDAEETAEG